MSSQPVPAFTPSLSGTEGELVWVDVAVEPRHLEELLDALAQVTFPMNPQIYHPRPGDKAPKTRVEFPAYSGRLEEVRGVLAKNAFDPGCLKVTSMLSSLRHP